MNTLKVILVSSVLLLAACATAPVQEMSNARQALDAARQVDAAQYAPDLMFRAKNRLIDAEKALEKGEWKKARKSAIQARIDAIAAREQVVSKHSEN